MLTQVGSFTPPRKGNAALGAAIFLCLVGLLVLGNAARVADKQRTELRTWPRVQAHVDSAAVVSVEIGTRRASYKGP